jgi:hypothetical protein
MVVTNKNGLCENQARSLDTLEPNTWHAALSPDAQVSRAGRKLLHYGYRVRMTLAALGLVL